MKNTSIEIRTLPVGQMKANCYVVWDALSKEALIIDPGDDADYIIKTILEEELTPRLIIATHGHFDHVMAALEIKLAYNIPFCIHKKDQFLLDRMNKTAMHFTGFDPGPPPEVDKYLVSNAKILVGDLTYKIIATPGHTPGCVSIYCKSANAIFVGDLVFADGSIGRTDFKYSSVMELSKSIRTISEFPKKTRIFSGHGDAWTVSQLARTPSS